MAIQNVELPDMDMRLLVEETPGSVQKWRKKSRCDGETFHDNIVLRKNCEMYIKNTICK